MAFTTLAGVNTALPGQRFSFVRQSLPSTTGTFSSAWAMNGLPAAGATPSSGLAGDVPTLATAGALAFVNPASGLTQVARLSVTGWASAGQGAGAFVCLYDRLWHDSGINVTIATSQTINSVALTRPDANGADVEAWWEVYAVMGAGTPTVTLGYTNDAGTASRTGSAGPLSTTMAASRTGPFTLAAGDTGVRSIQTWQADVTFTSGTIDLVLRRLVTAMPMFTYGVPTIDAIAVGLPRVYDNACLELLAIQSSAGSSALAGALHLVNG